MYRLEDRYWWYRALRDRVVALLDRYAGDARTFLDAGCGTGRLLQELRRRHSDVRSVGVDLSPHALARCRARSLRDLSRGSVNELPLRSGAFDVVTSDDVLYFDGVDDRRALAEFARVLRPGGMLVVNLPAFEFLRGAHDAFVSGRRRYTREHLTELLAGAGFRILYASYWNAALFPAVAIARRLRRTRGGARESDLRPLPQVWDSFFYALLKVEGAWLRRGTLPFGTSVLAAARKPPD
jgi:SAM-dependent methyltransferase